MDMEVQKGQIWFTWRRRRIKCGPRCSIESVRIFPWIGGSKSSHGLVDREWKRRSVAPDEDEGNWKSQERMRYFQGVREA